MSTSISNRTAESPWFSRCRHLLSKPVIRYGSDGCPARTSSRHQGPPQPLGFPKPHRSSVLPNQSPDWGSAVVTFMPWLGEALSAPSTSMPFQEQKSPSTHRWVEIGLRPQILPPQAQGDSS